MSTVVFTLLVQVLEEVKDCHHNMVFFTCGTYWIFMDPFDV